MIRLATIVWSLSPEAHDTAIEWIGDGPADDGKTAIIILVVNFVLLMLLLNKLLFKNLRSANAEVSDVIRLELEKATTARAAAESLMLEYENKLTSLEGEVEDIRSQAKAAAEAEAGRILADAADHALRIKQAAERAAEVEAARRRHDLEREIVALTLVQAEQAIRASFGSADQRRIVDSWVDEVTKADLSTAKVN